VEYTFLSATLLLILVADPFGNISLFANALKRYDARKRALIIVREHLIALGILFGFMMAGDHLLKALGLSGSSLQLAGGVVLFLIALRMIFPQPEAEVVDDGLEPLIVPLAVPLIAGPSTLATVMLLSSQAPDRLIVWSGVLVTAITFSAAVLLTASYAQRLLGPRVVIAVERLMGLVLVAVAVEMGARGIRGLLQAA